MNNKSVSCPSPNPPSLFWMLGSLADAVNEASEASMLICEKLNVPTECGPTFGPDKPQTVPSALHELVGIARIIADRLATVNLHIGEKIQLGVTKEAL